MFHFQNKLNMVVHANSFAPLQCDLPSAPK